MLTDSYRGRRVLVTGHTGFKGSWLALWLHSLGAEVSGYSLGLLESPSMFEAASIESVVSHALGDVRDLHQLEKVLDDQRPEIVFHLAAQPLVLRSYHEPTETMSTNVLGTANLLECVRFRPSIAAVVVVTSDKVYANDGRSSGYSESCPLGGADPYSASKACAELVARAYHLSYFRGSPTRVSTARAGNVIGGGDWAVDRIVPDAVRSWLRGAPVVVRNPDATRPWQHVLEPLSGYLRLGALLLDSAPGIEGEAFNFGPVAGGSMTVGDLVSAMAGHWPDASWEVVRAESVAHPEAAFLDLDCGRANDLLDWSGVLDLDVAVAMTMAWYRAWHDGSTDMAEVSFGQIDDYSSTAATVGASWAG